MACKYRSVFFTFVALPALFVVHPPLLAAPLAQASCDQTYVVQAGDTLANIALKLLGGREGYNLIADATNAAHETDASYTFIQDVNEIEVGMKLCIPERIAGVQAQTEGGIVEGFDINELVAYKGIPYAAPPVGNLRWRETQPVVPWTGIRRTISYGHDCMQAVSGIEDIQTTPAEDCLYLNVWRPSKIPQDTKLPVMVWIHGGGWVGGGSSIPYFDGSEFARQGIVVVSFNYRLGRFGYFAHPALLAANEGHVGNFGYMDQLAALKWVQNNIGSFGGDPARVTIVGESAGGGSVLAMLTSPVSKGLFHAAMILSGGGRQALVSRQMMGGTPQNLSADQIDRKFAESLGVRGTDTRRHWNGCGRCRRRG